MSSTCLAWELPKSPSPPPRPPHKVMSSPVHCPLALPPSPPFCLLQVPQIQSLNKGGQIGLGVHCTVWSPNCPQLQGPVLQAKGTKMQRGKGIVGRGKVSPHKETKGKGQNKGKCVKLQIKNQCVCVWGPKEGVCGEMCKRANLHVGQVPKGDQM